MDKKSECRNCYTCQKGVGAHMTKEMLIAEKAKRCKNCYTCQQGVSGDVTANGARQASMAERCKNCYTCQQGVDRNVTAEMMKQKSRGALPTFTWYIFPTNGCNIRCTYCYAHNKPGKMTKETMHQMLDWLFHKQTTENFKCHFFGGEPMVMWDMIVDIVQLGNEMAANNNRKVDWSMTTNGTLLDDERLAWLKDNFTGFLLSIDGRPETHDKYRLGADGGGTHHLIPVDKILETFPNLECRPTINPDTAKDWFEDYRWLRNKGFKSIAIEPNYEVDWSEEQLLDYEKMLRQLGKYWLYAQKVDKPIRMKFMDEVMQGLRSGKAPDGRMCGVAYNCGAIDHRGLLYACQRYASYNEPDTYQLGNIVDGWDEFKLFETQALFREQVFGDITKGFNCATCEVKNYCHKGCNAANIKFMGDRAIALPMYCILSKIHIKVGLEILSEFSALNLRDGKSNGACGCK